MHDTPHVHLCRLRRFAFRNARGPDSCGATALGVSRVLLRYTCGCWLCGITTATARDSQLLLGLNTSVILTLA